jgi:hypothetical protein
MMTRRHVDFDALLSLFVVPLHLLPPLLEGHGGRDADVEGGNVLAPNPKKRRVRIPSIVERGQRQKQPKKGKAVSTED